MHDPTRRQTLGLIGAGLSVATVSLSAGADSMRKELPPLSPAFAGRHSPKPLTFDPAKLPGLSQRLIQSHWQNNYVGSVKTLNLVEGRLAAAMQDKDFPAAIYGGLKREELHRLGSVILHEHYFSGLGGDGKVAGDIATALTTVYGSIDAWQAEFRRTAMSLAGGSGWCVLTYNRYTGELRNQWAWDHMHGAIAGHPLLVLDMYEHAYHMDYGTAAAKYIDAWFANLDWEVVDHRFRDIRSS